MSDCQVCGESTFECISGLYFCTTCQTQSQDIRAVEVDDFQSQNYKYSTRQASDKKKPTVVDKYGRPWTTIEGFQFVIKEQVKALIALGADPKLKEVVFELWVRYLTKTRIAFCSTGPHKKPLIKQYLTRSRDALPSDSKDPLVKQLTQEQLSDDETPLELYHRRRGPMCVYRHVERMSMAKTISFCYLGLLYTNNLTMPSDIVRGIRNGKIPYLNASSLFPEDTKFFTEDTITFNPANVLGTRRIRFYCGQLAHFLELEDIPAIPLSRLVSKYICQLDLPGELHGLATNLVSKQKPYLWINSKRARLLPPVECIAMAYIIILLKILFGLDGTTERKLSEFATEYAKYKEEDQKVFIWEEWVAHTSRNVAVWRLQQIARKQNEPAVIQDLESFLNYCQKSARYNNRISTLSSHRRNPDLHQSLINIFSVVGDRFKDLVPALNESFTLQPGNPLNSSTLLGDSASKKFQQTSIAYVTRPDTFLEQNPFNLSTTTIQSATEYEDSDHERDRWEREDSYWPASLDLFSQPSPPPPPPGRSPKVRSHVKKVVRRTLYRAKRQKITTEDRSGLLEKLSRAYKSYACQPTDANNDVDCVDSGEATPSPKVIPLSYQWLLSACSTLIEDNPRDVESQVKNLESLYKFREVNLSHRNALRNITPFFCKPK